MTSTPDAAVAIRGLRKSFGGTVALERIDLEIREGEFLSLLGPSGCGKTTLLRIIAGFEQPDEGDVLIGGSSALALPAYRRPVNTVFQSYALFPHMSVAQNVRFGLEMSRVPKDEANERVERAMATVEIEHLAERRPEQLSGGQQQRVALARAIVNEPEVLLLDEPLGALDLKLRKQLQVELMQLQQRLAMTFVYVTHDQEEALVMSDRIAVMNHGRIEQLGEAGEIYERPRTRYVATFLGSSNLFEGRVATTTEGRSRVDTPLGALVCEGELAPGVEVTLSVRPEKIYVVPEGAEPTVTTANLLRGRVEELVYTGIENQYLVRVGERLLSAYVMNKVSSTHDPVGVGDEVTLRFPARSVVPLDD